MKTLDLNFVRKQFPAFSEPSLKDQAFFENAGGSYACRQTIEILTDYYHKTKVQPYFDHPASRTAGEAMDASYESFAEYLHVSSDEVFFGPSTSQNTYVLAQGMRGYLQTGDEVIVTNQDHEANGGAWRRLADYGMVIKEWKVNPETGSLETPSLQALLTEKTKLIAFPHCSNIVGEINPVKDWTKLAHEVGAVVVCDGVSYAGHGFPDVTELGVDIYLFSLYKTYGPHQGAMIVRNDTMKKLRNQSHFFNDAEIHKRLIPAGPDHAQVAAAKGVTDYFDAVYTHHFENSKTNKGQAVHDLFRDTEKERLEPLLNFLNHHPSYKLIGPKKVDNRAPTLAIVPKNHLPEALARELGKKGIMCGWGHFYGYRVVEAIGIDVNTGVLRLSFVHYTSGEDVDRLMATLDRLQ
jgi:selenocysteine lyase/cysteine desulfurase